MLTMGALCDRDLIEIEIEFYWLLNHQWWSKINSLKGSPV